MQEVCDVLERLVREGTLIHYAIGGATAAGFHGEPLATRDVDVFVFIEAETGQLLLSLDPIYTKLNELGFREFEEEGILIHGLPVQFLVASPGLESEAVETAMLVEWDQLRRFRRHSLNSPKRQEPIMGGSLTQAVSPDHFYSLAPPRTPASNIQTFSIMFPFSEKSDQIASLCRKYDVIQLTVFGSAARDDFDPSRSDIDLIAEFRSPHLPGYADRYLDFALELQSLFGRPVDLLTPRAVRNARFAQAIRKDSIRIYESKDSQAA